MRRDSASILDMTLAAQTIAELVEGFDRSAFLADPRTQFAILYQITVLGEATKRISREFRSRHPTIPWRDIAGMRDRLVHDYDNVDLEEVWKVATIEAPQLLADLQPLLPSRSTGSTPGGSPPAP
jgi:uncharacterized protein with HEPN domain